MWLLFLPTLLQSLEIQAFDVFTFNGTSDSSATPSFAYYMVDDVNLPDKFILCSSIKLATFDDVSFFSIAGKDKWEWLRLDFRTFLQGIKLSILWDGKYAILRQLKNPRLDYWYHVCLQFDMTKSKVEVAVNGESHGSVYNRKVTSIPSKMNMSIGAGYDHRLFQHSVQFQGSVANVRIFKEGNVTDMSTMPCQQRQNIVLPWNPQKWKVVGSDWSLIEESNETYCVSSENYVLVISSRITINEGMDFCRKLNNSIIPFQQDPEAHLEYVRWHVKTTEGSCPSIWTPLSDEAQEGLFINMNNNDTVDSQAWYEDEPNGGKDENFVIVDPDAALYDVAWDIQTCSACNLQSDLLLHLDGLCEDSIIGNVEI